MKKIILALSIALTASTSFAQKDGIRIPNDTVNGHEIKIGKYKNLVIEYYPDKKGLCGEHIEISTGGSLTPYIKLSRLREFDSAIFLAFEKYKEWSRLADSLQSNPFEKIITTFTADYGMINDNGFASVESVEIKFVFSHLIWNGVRQSVLKLEAAKSDQYNIYFGSFSLEISDPKPMSREFWRVMIDKKWVEVYEEPTNKKTPVSFHSKPSDAEKLDFLNGTVTQQILSFRKMIDLNRIIKLYSFY